MKRKAEEVGVPRQIPPFFNPQKIGGSLREVDVSLIQAEDEKVVSRWFHGPHDADLFIWLDERNNVIKHQIAFCGQIVEWNVIDGVRTGVVIEQEVEGPNMGSSETIRFDNRPQNSAVVLALDLVKHVNSLDDRTRGEILHQLTARPTFGGMGPEEILKKYGPSSRDKIWSRFMALLYKIFR